MDTRAILAGMLAAGLVGTVPNQAGVQETVKIGLIMTYSGQFADAAVQIDNGIAEFEKVENVKDPVKARMKN